MDKRIKWQKWLDPMGSNKHEFGLEEKDLEDYEDDEDDIEFDDFHNNKKLMLPHNDGQVLVTPAGFIPLRNYDNATDKFDFYIMHTNFDITDAIVSVVEQTGGVESIVVLTRYRLKVGFPKSGLFDVEKIQKSIERRVLSSFKFSKNIIFMSQVWQCDLQTAHKIYNTVQEVKNNYDVWALCILPNGKINSYKSQQLSNKYYEKLTLFKNTSILTGAKIITFLDN